LSEENPDMNFSSNIAWPLRVSQWLNTDRPLTLNELRGRVVVLVAFQILCPGCVSHSLPQAQKIRAAFAESELTVLGLHTVFEHHAVMGPDALQAFIHEYQLNFPIGIDQAGTGDDIPLTMQAYAMRGTPTLILIDKVGRLRFQHFGRLDDLQLGAMIGGLLGETAATLEPARNNPADNAQPGCDADQCERR
jgi:peroxiredoxin